MPDDTTADPRRNRAANRRRLPLAVLVLGSALALLAGPALATAAEDAPAEAAGEHRIRSARFDFEAPADQGPGPLSTDGPGRIARYRSMVVDTGDGEVRLRPLPGVVRVAFSQGDGDAMAAEVDGRRFGPAAADFGDRVAAAASSDSANSYLRTDPDADRSVSIDLFYPRPLAAGDYVLVQEGGGDSPVDLTPIDADGGAIGPPRRVGPGYQWNTGHGTGDGQPSWASAVPVTTFDTDGRPVAGLRATAGPAELKVLALSAASPEPAEPRPTEVAAVAGPPDTDPTEVADRSGPPDTGPTEVADRSGPPVLIVDGEPDGAPPVGASPPEPGGPADSGSPSGPGSPPEPGAATEPGPVTAVAAPPRQPPDGSPAAVAAQGAGSSAEPPTALPQPADGPARIAAAGDLHEAVAITQLAHTGNLTDPWVMVVLAMGLIFIGYTVYAAFQRRPGPTELCGHEQLDRFGFD